MFANPRQDFTYLKQAFEAGRLTPQRVDQSVRRVLEMKARLGLNQNVESIPLSAAEMESHQAVAQSLAERSITLLRRNTFTPVALPAGAKVLTVTLTYDNGRPDTERWLPAVDEALRGRGFQVDHLDNPNAQVR